MTDELLDIPISSAKPTLSKSVTTVTFLVLIVATIIAWAIAGDSIAANAAERRAEHTSIILLATAKMYLILAIFMGLWKSPLNWHFAAASTLIITAGLLIFLVVSP